MNHSENQELEEVTYQLYNNEKFEQFDDSSSMDTSNSLKYESNSNLTYINKPHDTIVSVHDVARYILHRIDNNTCTTMKLHKLLYYSQAWSMVWCEKPLFKQKIEAWANGPVVRDFFSFHKGFYSINYNDIVLGNENMLSKEQKIVVDDVLNFYGDKTPQWLIELTHMEDPWIHARKGLMSNERGNKEISLELMQQYYSNL